ncbi:MAG TPA: hypothetical protein V6D08_13405 [Candidatus Obscuribacterales bacterium]
MRDFRHKNLAEAQANLNVAQDKLASLTGTAAPQLVPSLYSRFSTPLVPPSNSSPFGGTTIDVDNGIAYVEEVSRASAIEVSDPVHPRVIGKIDTMAVPMSVTDLSAHGDLLYLAAEQVGLCIYRLADTSARR